MTFFWSIPLAGLLRVQYFLGVITPTLKKKTFLGYLPQANNAIRVGDLKTVEIVLTLGEKKPMIKIQMICVYGSFSGLVTMRALS